MTKKVASKEVSGPRAASSAQSSSRGLEGSTCNPVFEQVQDHRCLQTDSDHLIARNPSPKPRTRAAAKEQRDEQRKPGIQGFQRSEFAHAAGQIVSVDLPNTPKKLIVRKTGM